MAVRKSSFRHVRGETVKKELQWADVKVSQSSWDSNKASISSKFCAISWSIGGGGAVGVVNIDEPYRLGASPALIVGHSASVTDVAFSPFNAHLLASSSDDGTVKLWNIPEGGLKENMSEPAVTLNGHTHKVGCIRWHPLADGILASSAQDQTFRLWDVTKPSNEVTVELGAYPTTFEWSPDGRYVVVSCKDKKVRLVDPRAGKVVAEWTAHDSMRPVRSCWLSNSRFITVGHSRMASREMSFWNLEDLLAGNLESIFTDEIDRVSSTVIPFYDFGTKMLFLAGKGDSSINFYEIVDEAPYAYKINAFGTTEPCICCVAYPKLSVNVIKTEIFRLMKICKNHMEPISFVAPRRVQGFHKDIFPDTAADKPSMTGSEWLEGANKGPIMVSMRPEDAQDVEAAAPTKFVAAAAETHKETDSEKIDRLEKENKHLKAELAALKARLD